MRRYSGDGYRDNTESRRCNKLILLHNNKLLSWCNVMSDRNQDVLYTATHITHGRTGHPEQLEQAICTMTLRSFSAFCVAILSWNLTGSVMWFACIKCGSLGQKVSTLLVGRDGGSWRTGIGHGQLPSCPPPLTTPMQSSQSWNSAMW